nr:DUF664 domain-containing protein [Thermocatellispora tengchongensis]
MLPSPLPCAARPGRRRLAPPRRRLRHASPDDLAHPRPPSVHSGPPPRHDPGDAGGGVPDDHLRRRATAQHREHGERRARAVEPGHRLPRHVGGPRRRAVAEQALVDAAFADLAREQAATDAALEGYPDLGTRVGRDGIAVRELWVHRIEEYARHCGHADLLRECIDGRVGQ